MQQPDINERSAYPHPDDFKVMRPEYNNPEEDGSDPNEAKAIITVAPFSVEGVSATRPGARRAALYEAAKVYKEYHPSYKIEDPYPKEFVDEQGTKWRRLSVMQKANGDYEFSDEDGSDYADIESMLSWDVRVKEKIA